MKISRILIIVIGLSLIGSIVFAHQHNLDPVKKETIAILNPDKEAHVHNIKYQFVYQEATVSIQKETIQEWTMGGDYSIGDLGLSLGYNLTTKTIYYQSYTARVGPNDCVCSKGHVWVRYYKTEYRQSCKGCSYVKYGWKTSLDESGASSITPPCTQKQLGCAE